LVYYAKQAYTAVFAIDAATGVVVLYMEFVAKASIVMV
jgi:hypothetical protein